VTVRAGREVLRRLTARSVEPSIDVAGLGPGRYGLAVRVAPGEDYLIVAIEPPTVSVRIQ
jgi:hypothetical protein